MRLLLAASLFLLAGLANAEPTKWFPVNMERGCVPMSDLYLGYPELTGKTTPADVFNVLQTSSKDTRMKPFADLYDSEQFRKDHPNGTTTAAEDAVRKLYTKSNALMITWSKNGIDDGLLFYDEALCKSLYGKLP